jgi:hypothetical protein
VTLAQYENTSEGIAASGSLTDTEPSSQTYCAVLFVAFALGTYLSVPLAPGGRLLVPSVLTVGLMPVLFLAVRRSLTMTDVLFVLNVFFMLCVSIALSPGYEYIQEKVLSLIQLCLALAAVVMTVRLMRQMRLEVLERALLVLALSMVVLAVLELLGVTRAVSDAFRLWAYDGVFTLYSNEDRDLNMVGWERPKVFSEEPSHATRMFVASINAWLLVRVTPWKVAIAGAATAIMLLIMGSPIVFASAAITLTIFVWNKRASVLSRVTTVLLVALASTLFVTFYDEGTLSKVVSRVERIGDRGSTDQLQVTSENLRLVIPYLTLADTWSRWPFFGVGIGGKEIVMEHTSYPGVQPRHVLGTNVMGELGTYLGLIGAAWFLWLLARQGAATGVQRLGLLLLICAIMAQLEGGMMTFRFWGFIALYWGALAVVDSLPEPNKRVEQEASPAWATPSRGLGSRLES